MGWVDLSTLKVGYYFFSKKKADMVVVSLGVATATKGEKLLQRYVMKPNASLITGAAAIAILARRANATNFVSGWLLMFSYMPFLSNQVSLRPKLNGFYSGVNKNVSICRNKIRGVEIWCV